MVTTAPAEQDEGNHEKLSFDGLRTSGVYAIFSDAMHSLARTPANAA